jgi:hypothetical protein
MSRKDRHRLRLRELRFSDRGSGSDQPDQKHARCDRNRAAGSKLLLRRRRRKL